MKVITVTYVIHDEIEAVNFPEFSAWQENLRAHQEIEDRISYAVQKGYLVLDGVHMPLDGAEMAGCIVQDVAKDAYA